VNLRRLLPAAWRKSAAADYRVPDALLPPPPWEAASGAATAVAGACVDLIGRSLAAGRPSAPYDGALTPPVLAQIGRELASEGNSLWVPENGATGLQGALVPVSCYEITGTGPNPAAWTYELEYAIPDGSRTRRAMGSRVLHFRVRQDRRAPWRGRGALADGRASAMLAGALEANLNAEIKFPPVWAISISESGGVDADQAARLTKTVERRRRSGEFFLLGGQPGNAVSATRAGSEPAQSLVQLRAQIASEVAGLFGVPRALLSESAPGQAQREAYRRFNHSTLAPLARVIEAEVAAKTGEAMRLDLAGLYAADITARARAYKGLIDSGMAPAEAGRLVGFG